MQPSIMQSHPMQRKLIRLLFPHYRGRWEEYDDLLLANLGPEKRWVDVGCGRNEHVAQFGHLSCAATGVDRMDHPGRAAGAFIQADMHHLPFPDAHADLVTLRMVVEHLPEPDTDLADIARVLKPGGKVIVLTTNARSPIVFLPRLLPTSLKIRLIRTLFGVAENDVFPTYHRFNSASRLTRGASGLRLIRLAFLEQLSPVTTPAFILFFLWYCLTRLRLFRPLCSNILAVMEKPVV